MVSSLFLRSSVASLACLSFIGSATASSYQLQDNFSGASFFNNFDFFTDPDPTRGFVKYVDQGAAQALGIISSADGQPAVFGVDAKNVAVSPGRTSVRLTSKKAYTHALIISDIAHMPGGICGTWPAHWTLGTGVWPANGEIDIIEGVNNAATNLMSLHTSPGCTIAGSNETGTLQSNDCDTTKNFNSGCGVTADTTASYGTGFNGGVGGVYATEWTSAYIRIWFFPRGSIPADITAGTPDPTTWGLPQANLQGSCDIDSKFANHQIIFDTTFCGDYGNADWNKNPTCMALQPGGTCSDYVAANPQAFTNAFWSVNSVKVYQQPQPTTTAATVPLTSATPVSSVLAPGMGNTTSASGTSYKAATQTSAAATATNPATIGPFKLLGCASSTNAFQSFVQVDNNAAMSLDKCVVQCGAASYAYAGVFNTLCFCARALDSNVNIDASGAQCKNPCPGNLNQLCGGTISSARLAVRQASNNILLTVYQNTLVGALVSVTPASLTVGYGMGMGAPGSPITNVVLSTTYVDVCNTCPGGFSTCSYTTTIAQCGCVAQPAGATYAPMSAVAMQTVQTVCASCGVNGAKATVAVTVPAAIAAQATSPASAGLVFQAGPNPVTTLPNGVVATGVASNGTVKFTGGANVGQGVGALLGLAAVGAMMIVL